MDLQNLRVDDRVILKWILNKWFRGMEALRSISWEGHVARISEMSGTCRFFAGKPEGKSGGAWTKLICLRVGTSGWEL
jgi:hypothetical protein